MSEQCQHSQDDTFDFEDEDTCTPTELEQYFKHKYKIHDKVTITNDDNYVLKLAKDDSLTCVAAGLSDGSVRILEIASEKGYYIKPPQSKKRIFGIRFLDETPNLLLVGTENGQVRLFDLRTQGVVSRFAMKRYAKHEPTVVSCFDVNTNGTLLCMGTNEHWTNVHMLFYDIRTTECAFSYIDSHQNDVTSVRFHPVAPHIICSGSTDGLINIFDAGISDEDDALLTTINTEDTAQKLNWHISPNNQERISCITNTNNFKTYNCDGDLIAEFDRSEVTKTIKRKNEANSILIDCHNTYSNDMLLLIGSNNGEFMRSCIFDSDALKPNADFENINYLVRESILDAKTNIVITAGETDIVTFWKPFSSQTASTNSSSSNLKMKTKSSNRVIPY